MSSIVQSKRQTFNNEDFNKTYELNLAKSSKFNYPSSACLRSYCQHICWNILPFIHVLRRYKWKNWFVGDLLGGLSSGVMQVPQGMGFAAQLGLPAYFGLYTSFFPAAIYFFFGSSRHVSVGVVGLIEGMVARITTKHLQDCVVQSPLNGSDPIFCSNPNGLNLMTANNTYISIPIIPPPFVSSEKQQVVIGLVVAMQCCVGLIFIAMFVLRLGFLGCFISQPFNSAIQTASGVMTSISQIAPALGYQSPGFYGVWNVPNQLKLIFQNISKTNVADALVALITIISVLILREHVNVKFDKKLKHPIPAELIMMVIGTIISHFAELNRRFGLVVTGDTPRGFLAPKFPILAANIENKYMLTTRTQFQLNYSFIFDCLAMAIAIYGITITLSKALARKHRYVLDDNQELLAYGLGHFVSSFFYCFPVSQGPPRTLLMEANGAKSQLAGLISAVFVLIVIVAIGPLFYSLPRALLATVIFTAVCPIFRNFLDLRLYWKTNKWDIIVWLVTFISALLLDPFMAIAIGIGTNLFTMSLNAAFVSAESLSLAENTEIFINQKMYKRVANFKGVKIFRFNGNICFLNVDNFKKQLFRLTVHPHEVKRLQEKSQTNVKPNLVQAKQVNGTEIHEANECSNRHGRNGPETNIQVEEGDEWQRSDNEVADVQVKEDIASIRSVIIDCSRINFVDSNGVMCLRQLLEDYKSADIRLRLANCSPYLLTILDTTEFQAVLFPSVFDAVMSVINSSL